MDALISLLAGSAYLASTVAASLAATALVLVDAGRRRELLLSGLLSSPLGLLAYQFVPAHWQPLRHTVGGVAVEDLLFSFATGVAAWAIATHPVRRRLRRAEAPGADRLGALALVAFGGAAWFAARVLGAGPLDAHVAAGAAVAVAAVLVAPAHWPLAAAGAAGSAALYGAFTAVVFRLWPDFSAAWNWAALSGATVAGVPVEELAWAATFGAVWPLLGIRAFGLRLEPARQAREAMAACTAVPEPLATEPGEGA